MSKNLAWLSIAFGIALLILAFVPGGRFYPGLPPGIGKKPVRRWFGQLWFTAVAAWLLYVGMNYLLRH